MENSHIGTTKKSSSQLNIKTKRDNPETMIKPHDYMFMCVGVGVHLVEGNVALYPKFHMNYIIRQHFLNLLV